MTTNIGGIAELVASFVGHRATAHDNIVEYIKAGHKPAECGMLAYNLHGRWAMDPDAKKLAEACLALKRAQVSVAAAHLEMSSPDHPMHDDIKKISKEVSTRLTQKSQSLVGECETTLIGKSASARCK